MNDITQQLFRLDGKVAVIIGGTGELCGSMSIALASAGAKIVIAGRNREKADTKLKQIEAQGSEGIFIETDATNKQSLQSLLDATVAAYEKVDILINGAGVNAATPFLDIPEDEVTRIFDVNYKSVFLACQIFGARLIEQEIGGSIINIGSMSGLVPAQQKPLFII